MATGPKITLRGSFGVYANFSDNAEISGGDGNFTITDYGDNGRIVLGSGTQNVVATGAGKAIYLGNNAGLFASQVVIGRNAQVYGGNGNINLTALGNGNRVALGNGNQTITANGAGQSISIGDGAGCAGGSVICVGGGSVVSTGRGDNHIVAAGNANRINTLDGSQTVQACGTDNQVVVGNNDSASACGGSWITVGARSLVVAGDGAQTIAASGGGATISVGAGNDTITLTCGGGNDVSLGAGCNAVFLCGGGNVVHDGAGVDRILAGCGDDVFQPNYAGGSVAITGFDAGDRIDLTAVLAGLHPAPGAAGLADLVAVSALPGGGCGTRLVAHGLGGVATVDLIGYNAGGLAGLLAHDGLILPI